MLPYSVLAASFGLVPALTSSPSETASPSVSGPLGEVATNGTSSPSTSPSPSVSALTGSEP